MKKIIAVLLVCVMLASVCFAFSSCGKTTVVGKWQTKIDPQKFFGASSEESSDETEETSDNPLAGIEFTGDIKLYIEFTDDGKYTASLDQDDYKNVISQAADALVEGLVASLGGSDMSVDEVLQLMGVDSKEEFVAQMLEDDGFEDKSGEYKYSDGELKLGEDTFKVDLAKKTLVLKEIVDPGEEDDNGFADLLPMTFDRIG